MIAAPQGDLVEVHAQSCAGQCRYEELFRTQFLAGAHRQAILPGQSILPGQANGLPGHRIRRLLLHRGQQPLIGLGQACHHSPIGSLALGLGLTHLVRVEVEAILFGKN